ncbi:MAG TPA: magnesium/cobalt transporter CorA [Kofleriaceae bacterium]|nr:magnesium/cobalt transporter CorA [Kofleriaceae bacterium]
MNVALFRKRHPPVGSRPGTLVVSEQALPPRVRVIQYGLEEVEERGVASAGELTALIQPERVTWVDVQGLGDEVLLRRMGEIFNIHPLALEDVVNAPQRPKAEEYDDHLLLVTRMARLINAYDVDREQVAIFVGAHYILTFQEHYGDVLDPVRQRIRDGLGMIRKLGADYLGYAIIDTIVDAYYPVVEALSERLERLEDRVMTGRSTRTTLDRLNRIKNDAIILRRSMWPQLEALGRLMRESTRYLSDEVRIYLRDTNDHCAQVVDVLDSSRELINGLLNTYLSIVSNRTNEVMKVLTIMASIFIPLTFVAGIYGMNFDYMPELHSRWGYPIALLVMLVASGGLLFYFRHRGWLGGGSDDDDDEEDERARPA